VGAALFALDGPRRHDHHGYRAVATRGYRSRRAEPMVAGDLGAALFAFRPRQKKG